MPTDDLPPLHSNTQINSLNNSMTKEKEKDRTRNSVKTFISMQPKKKARSPKVPHKSSNKSIQNESWFKLNHSTQINNMTFDDMCPEGPSQRRVSWCQSNFEGNNNNIQSSENLSQA